MLAAYRIFAQKYDVCCTNPPYLGSSRFNSVLDEMIKMKYADEKSDLSMAMFRNAVDNLTKNNGYTAFITTSSWFFLSSFEKLRQYILSHYQISSIVDFGTELFDGKVGHNPIVSWVLQKTKPYSAFAAVRLVDYCYARRGGKRLEFFNKRNYYIAKQENFSKIPGLPVAYWVSENFIRAFERGKLIGDLIPVKKGMDTGNNDYFLRFWYEIAVNNFSPLDGSKKWITYDKGGNYRKWYGNNEYVLNWENNGSELKNSTANLRSMHLYFKSSITWNALSSSNTCFRFSGNKGAFDSAGSSMFPEESDIPLYLGYMNANVCQYYLNLINPTLNYGAGSMAQVPIIVNEKVNDIVSELVKDNISISKTDWDSFETSWDFAEHPLVRLQKGLWDATATGAAMQAYYGEHIKVSCPVELCYMLWQGECNQRFNQLKANEEELNRIFIDIYGLQDELTPEVEDKDVTVRKADLQREIKSLISYAVGCMFGRYSLDKEGLIFAGGEWDERSYRRFIPDADNIIPITDEEYFSDDIVGRFVEFVRVVYGEDTLEQNLDFIAKSLGNKGNTSRQIIRNYFMGDFIKDHIKTYQKRPIYWLFDSGKQNGFKALVYMHRWNADTIGKVRVDYLHKLQRVYESEIARMQETIDNSTNSREVANAEKRKDKLLKQLKETREYDEKISHLALARIDIDLDDGVKVNYEKVQTAQDGKKLEILVPIK